MLQRDLSHLKFIVSQHFRLYSPNKRLARFSSWESSYASFSPMATEKVDLRGAILSSTDKFNSPTGGLNRSKSRLSEG